MHTVLSYSFVGAWKSPMTQIPLLDKKFSMDLFNDPYNTIVGLDQSGFIISKQSGKLPHPTVVINSQRLSITCHTLEQLVVVYEKILEEINAVAGDRIPLYFNSFGLNTEHEYADLDQDGPVWLTKHFIENGFNNKEKFFSKATDLRFEISNNDDKKYGIILQPRANLNNALFIAINDHRIWNQLNSPDKKVIEDLFQESLNFIKNEIFKLIF